MTVPSDLGFSPVFRSYRPGQYEHALRCLESDATALSLPTGYGKSLIYMSAAMLSKARTVIVTGTKALQDQLMRDFGQKPGLTDVRGMSNYPCRLKIYGEPEDKDDISGGHHNPMIHGTPAPEDSCEQGVCHEDQPCSYEAWGCHYFDQIRRAKTARVVVTNYAFWILCGDRLGDRDLLILDEAHEARNWVINMLETRVSPTQVKRIVSRSNKPPPKLENHAVSWKTWATAVGGVGVRDLDSKLERIRQSDGSWFCEWKPPFGLHMGPVQVERYLPKLLRKTQKVIFSSATLTKAVLHQLGVHNYKMIEANHLTPPERRPIIHIPTYKLSIRTRQDEWDDVYKTLDKILRPRVEAGRKGIIHTVSYQRAESIVNRSEYYKEMIKHDRGAINQAIAEFRARSGPAILVSGCLVTGFDFPDSQCRYQVQVKVPYPSSNLPYYQAQQRHTKRLGAFVACQQLVQAYGRGVRSEDDWCEYFILDDMITYLLRQNRDAIPPWFWRHVTRASMIPKMISFNGRSN